MNTERVTREQYLAMRSRTWQGRVRPLDRRRRYEWPATPWRLGPSMRDLLSFLLPGVGRR